VWTMGNLNYQSFVHTIQVVTFRYAGDNLSASCKFT
jgi:hypothetical protein